MGATPLPEKPNQAKAQAVCGTAFSIGKNVCLTAAHVWANVQQFPIQAVIAVTNPLSREGNLVKIDAGETFTEIDIAVIRVSSVEWPTPLTWSRTPLDLLTDVETFGYPYGFDAESQMFNVRAFRGHVVGGKELAHLSGRPAALEVSFACPRGLSGAPLVISSHGAVAGVIVGNDITEMVVYSEKESLAESGRETVLVKTEALHLGVAVTASAILAQHSELLGGTIEAWVRQYGLLAG